jgi:hypothetical protein
MIELMFPYSLKLNRQLLLPIKKVSIRNMVSEFPAAGDSITNLMPPLLFE